MIITATVSGHKTCQYTSFELACLGICFVICIGGMNSIHTSSVLNTTRYVFKTYSSVLTCAALVFGMYLIVIHANTDQILTLYATIQANTKEAYWHMLSISAKTDLSACQYIHQ